MNENNKLNHLRENKDDTDYVKVYDRTLKKEKFIPIKDILWNSSIQLKEVVESHWEGINELGKRVDLLEQENKKLKDLLEKIWGGLNSR